jgi:hypothetical protein
MRRWSIALAICLLCGSLLAQQPTQRGKIKKVDTEKGLVTITTAEGKDVECALGPQTVIHDANNQDIAEFLRSFKIAYVADMQQIEATIRQDDGIAGAAPFRHLLL